jgi:hypothetical protein
LEDIVFEGIIPSRPQSPRPTGRGLINYRKLNSKEINLSIQTNATYQYAKQDNKEFQEFQSQHLPFTTVKKKSKITKKKQPRVPPRDPNSPRPGVTFQSLSSLNPPKGLYLIPNLNKISSESNKFTPPTPVGFFTPITPVELNSTCITGLNTVRESENDLNHEAKKLQIVSNVSNNVSDSMSTVFDFTLTKVAHDLANHNNNEISHTNCHVKDHLGQYETNKSFSHNPCDDSDGDNEKEKGGKISGEEKIETASI